MLTSFIEKETHCSHRSKVTREMAWLRRQDSHGNDPEHWYCHQSGAAGPKEDVCTHRQLFDSTSHTGSLLPYARDFLSTLRVELCTFGLGKNGHSRRRRATTGCRRLGTRSALIWWFPSSTCVGRCGLDFPGGVQRRRQTWSVDRDHSRPAERDRDVQEKVFLGQPYFWRWQRIF